MVVKTELKLIRSLQQKKKRAEYQRYVAEGVKMVGELLRTGLQPEKVYATEPGLFDDWKGEVHPISETELRKVSSLKNPNKALAVFPIPQSEAPGTEGWILALDGIKDPGNLGTIIRLCDWFGIRDLVCAEDTVDCYNPKVLQATMGSIARVNITYTDLPAFLKSWDAPIYGATMEGRGVGDFSLGEKGCLVMGNEAHGLSKAVGSLLSERISIPAHPGSEAESLNVATATAILLHEIRRG